MSSYPACIKSRTFKKSERRTAIQQRPKCLRLYEYVIDNLRLKSNEPMKMPLLSANATHVTPEIERTQQQQSERD
jgi:hypothetical protein